MPRSVGGRERIESLTEVLAVELQLVVLCATSLAVSGKLRRAR